MARPRTFFGLPLLPLLLGLLFFAVSLTPSLIPRSGVVQGVLGGVVGAAGYMIGRFLLTVWRQMYLPLLRGRRAEAAHTILAIPILGVLVFCLANAGRWQNQIRVLMGREPEENARVLGMVLLATAVFAALLILGTLIRVAFDRTRRHLYRYMPERTADVAGLILVAAALFFITRDGIVDRLVRAADNFYASAQELFETGPPPPGDPFVTGSAGSLVEWAAMGQPGRDYVTGGPDAEAIAGFTGRPALRPIRIYVGLAQAESAEERAEVALQELIRQGGFEREVLIVAMPTGTGWLDPGSMDVVEFMHGGDIATVAVQYSYLQSPLALILETGSGLDQARALIRTVHEYWRTLPEDGRPRLYMHGLSLGAWASMFGTDLFALLDDPIDGALWAGPPFPSSFWNQAVAARNPGSPYVAPVVGDGRLIRFASHFKPAGPPDGWGNMRLVFLQYSSDPIVFYEPTSLFRAPAWMREPPAPDVSPELRFIPVVTQFQLAMDMALANTAPPGHGHAYYAPDYIGPWRAVTAPSEWTDADSARLAAHCAGGFQTGCGEG
ncbi:hypothetical protein GI374_05705 [Paracoccus sp. S-4012]|uniref:alpha/beta hydrolase n=1 Tax=Paracoccus sp. S-4012 TaxID=2665648 RepID=UPI0012B05576|nr:alpha/beta-hydrolase family protein [Paracoccus sp. S-4012]MRX49952.1 hypothetical protein [Paracoccus sp. S-4012]